MKRSRTRTWTRNRLLRAVVLAPAAYLLAACTGGNGDSSTPETGGQAAASGTAVPATGAARNETSPTATAGPPITQSLPPTPDCGDDDEPTIAQTEGPYFTPNSPERTSLLEPGISGTRLLVAGFVLTTDCQPVSGALVDFWQCDDAGAYDNRGYRLRGHQFTDTAGRYSLETIVPGVYPGRTRHIHVKVQAPNSRLLTTQQYFPDEPGNSRDGIFNPALVMDVQDTPNGKAATFNYVLDLG
ncbi:MAG: dioxygenase [Dehalococcoidia bacterium]